MRHMVWVNHWANNRYVQLVCITVIFGLFLFVSTYRLTESPPTWFDEGWFGQVAYNIVDTGQLGVRVSPTELASASHTTGGYAFLYPSALFLKTFGKTFLNLRITAVLFIVLLFGVVAAFSYELWGFAGLVPLMVVFSYPSIYGNGKNFLAEIPALLYLFTSLYFLYRLEKENNSGMFRYGITGVILGLCITTKPIMIPFSAGVLVVYFMRRAQFPARKVILLTIGLVSALALWVFTQFTRSDTIADVLYYYVNPYHVANEWALVLQNIPRLITESTPFYYIFTLVIWIASVIVRFRKKIFIYGYEFAAILFSVLILFAYLRTPGWYRYLFICLVLNLFFFSNNIQVIATMLSEKFQQKKKLILGLATILITCIVLVQVRGLFVGSWVAGSYDSKKTAHIRELASRIPQGRVPFVYNAPELVLFLQNSQNYFQYEAVDNGNVGTESLLYLKAGVPDYVLMHADAYVATSSIFTQYPHKSFFGGYLLLQK